MPDFLGRILVILEHARKVSVVGRQIEMAVAAQAKKDGARSALCACLQRFIDCNPDGMRGLRRQQNTFGVT